MNHFEHQTNSVNSLGLAGQSGACIPEGKSSSFSLHLQKCAGLAALVCKLKVAQESSPLPLSTQGTWDTDRQVFNFIWFGFFHARSEITQVCNGDFSSELQANVMPLYKSYFLVQI